MKIIPLGLLLSIKLTGNENWIEIKTTEQTQTPKATKNLDINLSQIEPINKMMHNITLVKQLMDVIPQKEAPAPSDNKNWFILNAEEPQQ